MSDATAPLTESIMLNGKNMTNSSFPDGEREISPLMLSNGIPTMTILLLMMSFAIFGSTNNGFFVASFIIERDLQKIGYTYLACAGMADLLLTFAVMSVSAVVLLSGQWDIVDVCKVTKIIVQTTTYAYSLFYMMAALEYYFRFCRPRSAYRRFLSIKVAWISIFIWLLSFALSVIGSNLDLDYDYCENKFYGNITFRIATLVLMHGIPEVATFALLVTTKRRINQCACNTRRGKRSRSYEDHNGTTSMHITANALFVASWIPYLAVIYALNPTDGHAYYYTMWLALLRSVFTSFLYGITVNPFRRPFADLYKYCFCKIPLPIRRNNNRQRQNNYTRPHRPLEHKRAAAPVRAHALEQIARGYQPTATNGASQATETTTV